MNSIRFVASGMYLPKKKVENKELNRVFNIDDNWIYQRTGIKQRYWTEEETTLDLAIKKEGPFSEDFTKHWYHVYEDLTQG